MDDVAVNFSLESADELMTAVGLREKLGEKRRGATPLRRNSPRQHSARCSPSTFGVVKLIFFSVVQRLSPLPVQTDEVACHMACRFSPLPRLPPLCLHSELLSFGCSFPLGLACHVSRGSSASIVASVTAEVSQQSLSAAVSPQQSLTLRLHTLNLSLLI